MVTPLSPSLVVGVDDKLLVVDVVVSERVEDPVPAEEVLGPDVGDGGDDGQPGVLALSGPNLGQYLLGRVAAAEVVDELGGVGVYSLELRNILLLLFNHSCSESANISRSSPIHAAMGNVRGCPGGNRYNNSHR